MNSRVVFFARSRSLASAPRTDNSLPRSARTSFGRCVEAPEHGPAGADNGAYRPSLSVRPRAARSRASTHHHNNPRASDVQLLGSAAGEPVADAAGQFAT